MSKPDEVAVDFLDRVAILVATLSHAPPNGFTTGAIRLLQFQAGSGEGHLLAVQLDGQGANDLCVACRQLGLFGFQRNILLPENLGIALFRSRIQ